MSILVQQLDRFVRWFFNSSPTVDLIEPTVPRRQQGPAMRPTSVPSPRRRSDGPHHSRTNRINA